VIVYLNGRFLPEEQATLSIHDAGFLAGDGVFETALLYQGGFLHLPAHLERFGASAAALRLPAPSAAQLDTAVRRVVRENALRDANLRITLTRGYRAPTLLITARAPDPRHAEHARRGWHLVTATTRRPSTAAVPAQLKALGRTYALLARQEAADADVDDALLLTDSGDICEGPSWNVFWQRGSTLFTPALELGVLAGITRTAVIQLAPQLGLAVEEGRWRRPVLDDAEEIFATMTSLGVVSCRSLDGRTLDPEPRTAAALQALYWDDVARAAAADPA
jgi:branched-chain amino acid aminotransferase